MPFSGLRLALIAQGSLLITSLAVHHGGAPNSLVHGLCTRNAVYSVVKEQRRKNSFLTTMTKIGDLSCLVMRFI